MPQRKTSTPIKMIGMPLNWSPTWQMIECERLSALCNSNLKSEDWTKVMY